MAKIFFVKESELNHLLEEVLILVLIRDVDALFFVNSLFFVQSLDNMVNGFIFFGVLPTSEVLRLETFDDGDVQAALFLVKAVKVVFYLNILVTLHWFV